MRIQGVKTGFKVALCAAVLGAANLLSAQTTGLVAEGGECLMYAMGLWGDAYRAKSATFNLDVRVEGEAKAMQDLSEGRAQMALLARDATAEELSAFSRKWGYPPVRVAVAMDALVWVVNKDNPVKQLSLPQIEAIFCRERTLGWPKDVVTWGDAGVSAPEWSQRPITRYARTQDSSVTGLIQTVMPPSPPKVPTPALTDGMAVAETLAADASGISTANMVEIFASLRAVPIVPVGTETAVEPTPDTVSSGAYPFSRYLYVYLNKPPKQGLEPTLKGFLSFALSAEGQQLVKAAGQAPLGPDITTLSRLKVER